MGLESPALRFHCSSGRKLSYSRPNLPCETVLKSDIQNGTPQQTDKPFALLPTSQPILVRTASFFRMKKRLHLDSYRTFQTGSHTRIHCFFLREKPTL